MFYLLQGVFFQGRRFLGIDFRPVEGIVPVLKEGILTSMFSGAISSRCEDSAGLVGSLVDQYGESILTNVYLEPNRVDPVRFSFTKQYTHREDLIDYVFEKKVGNVWVGQWKGSAVGSGVAKCKLTEVTDDDFFDPVSAMVALGMIKETKV